MLDLGLGLQEDVFCGWKQGTVDSIPILSDPVHLSLFVYSSVKWEHCVRTVPGSCRGME